jgi:hypothetical protein
MIVYNPTLRRQFAEKLGNVLIQTKDKINFRNQFYKMPLIHTRSKLVAECVFVLLAPAVDAARKAFERNYAEDTMLRVAMMSERYHLANGKYPDKLEDLVPKYIDMVPIDPCTGRTTFVYKLRSSIKESEPEPDTKQPTETTTTTNKSPEPLKFPYILYSLGHDGKDDNGIRQNSGKDGFDLVF